MTQNYYKQFDARIDELMSKMTLREKIGQLNQIKIPINPEDLERVKGLIARGEVGSFILAGTPTAGNDAQSPTNAAYTNELQKFAIENAPHGIPIIFGRDVIHGHHTVYPLPLASACSFNPELIEKCYRATAKEASAEGVHWTFSPMLDVCHDPRWGRMVEGPGEDPYLGACFARAAVRGFQGDNLSDDTSLAACAKHFLGYGYSEGGRDYNRTEISDYTLYNYVLPAFRAAIEEGAATVMSSFNDISGRPVSGTAHYLTGMLREKLGFEGFVISDWDAVKQLINHGTAETREECAKQALPAGVDMDMVDSIYLDCLEGLVKSGELDEKYIDLAVRRILRVKMAKGLFEKPYTTVKMPDRAEHIKLARELACESMLLLKNKGEVLPLKKDSSIVLAGTYKDGVRILHGTWTLDGKAEETATFTEAMREVLSQNGGRLNSVPNDHYYDDNPRSFFYKQDAIVLALGESNRVTGETAALADISLPEWQVKLAKQAYQSGNKVIGVIFAGRPVCLQEIEPYLDAILYAWHSGTETAHAAADIIFGDFNPCGKAAATFLRATGQVPLYYNVTPGARLVNSYYGDFLSYMDNFALPMYPFGFGLSYTEFEISEIKAERTSIKYSDLMTGDAFKLSVNVKNTGERDGKETVQLYIRDVKASWMRPLRELKAFKKELYRAGEEKVLTFELGKADLGFYTDIGDYVVEPGRFEIYIGDDCLTKNKIDITVE